MAKPILNQFGQPLAPVRTKTIKAKYAGAIWQPSQSWIPFEFDDYEKCLPTSDRRVIASKQRNFYQNFSLITSTIDRMVSYIVGNGLKLIPMSDDEKWNADASRLLERWTYFCDRTEMLDFDSLQATAVRSALIDGDAFIVMSIEEYADGNLHPRITLYPQHMIGDEKDDGAIRDKDGRITHWIIGGNQIEAKNVVRIAFPKFIGEVRSVSLFAPVIGTVHDYLDTLSAERQVVKNQTNVDRIITTKTGEIRSNENVASSIANDFLGAETVSETDDVIEREDKVLEYRNILGPSTVVLHEGDKYESFTSNRPSPAWMGLMESLERQIVLATSLPAQVILGQKLGGVADRREIASAERIIESYQKQLFKAFNKIYRFVIGVYIAQGKLAKNDVWYDCKIITPRFLTADYGRQTQADLALLEAGQVSLSEFAEPYGEDLRSMIRKRADEILIVQAIAKEKGIDPAILVPALFPKTSNNQ